MEIRHTECFSREQTLGLPYELQALKPSRLIQTILIRKRLTFLIAVTKSTICPRMIFVSAKSLP